MTLPLLISGVKHPMLVAVNGSVFTCTQAHTPSPHNSLSLTEINKQVDSKLWRVITDPCYSCHTWCSYRLPWQHAHSFFGFYCTSTINFVLSFLTVAF